MNPESFSSKIFNIRSQKEFNGFALELFHYQVNNNKVYHQYVKGIGVDPGKIECYTDIPFLPIEFFKTHGVYCGAKPEKYFASSGTTGSVESRHWYSDTRVYESSFVNTFEWFYGSPEQYEILALLPSYLERSGSSLVFMVNRLAELSKKPGSGFYLYDHDSLIKRILFNESSGIKTLLIGVTFALIDLSEKIKTTLKHTLIMETGGMKGRREELTRQEVHEILGDAFGVHAIHSEYGMTELFSQAYSKGSGYFTCPLWMKVLIRDINDPLALISENHTGGINIIDLANIGSCAFIATQDLGKIPGKGIFEVLGRFDYSDVRGCNLMVT